jgi:uroporphyrinogen-III synthase
MGEATAESLIDCGLSPALQATTGSSEDLARQLLALDPQATPSILFPRAQGGRDEAIALLRNAGCEIELHVAYASEAVAATDPALLVALAELSSGSLDGVAFFAPSQVHALLEHSPESFQALAMVPVIAAIGATTAGALADVGLQANAVADEPTSKDLVDKILQAFS